MSRANRQATSPDATQAIGQQVDQLLHTIDLAALTLEWITYDDVPHLPGVYILIDDQSIDYIGQSVDLRHRLTTHPHFDHKRPARIGVISDALLADNRKRRDLESQMIEHFRPAKNIKKRNLTEALAVRLPLAQIEALEDVAGIEQVNTPDLLRFILQRFIDDYQAGKIQIPKVERAVRYSIK